MISKVVEMHQFQLAFKSNFAIYLITLIKTQVMLAQIPRKPTFPEYMINQLITRIENDVNNDVIPVSAGIYSQYKLKQKLEAIPKPLIVDYNDPIFFDVANYGALPCKFEKCLNCNQQYGTKKNIATQCKFCGVWLCSECICQRKRYHPRARQSNTPRFQICYKCDDKFLSLTLNHGYVQSKAILEEAINKVREQKNVYERQCDQRQQDSTVTKDTVAKNKFKISSMKKEKIDLKKNIDNLRKEKQQLLFKIHIRQQYVAQIKEKSERIKEQQKRKLDQETQVTRNEEKDTVQNSNQKKPEKVKRALTQKNVISEVIFQQKTEKQEQKAVQQQRPEEQEQVVQPKQQEEISLPVAQETKTEEIVKNFFNFHEWGHADEEKKVQELVNSPKQQNYAKSFEQQTKIDENYPSPKANILNEQAQNVKQSFARKRLAEIFKKQEKQEMQLQQQQLSETQSLDAEVIENRRKDIMKAAILQSQFQRMSMEENQATETSVGQKCTCDIY